MVHRNNETNLNYVVTKNAAETTPYPIETDATTKSDDEPFNKLPSAITATTSDAVSSTLLSATKAQPSNHVTSTELCTTVALNTPSTNADGHVLHLKKKVTRSLSDRGHNAINNGSCMQHTDTITSRTTESVRLKTTGLTKTKSAGSLPSNNELSAVNQELPPRSHFNSRSFGPNKFRKHCVQVTATNVLSTDDIDDNFMVAISDLMDKDILLDNEASTNSSRSFSETNTTTSSSNETPSVLSTSLGDNEEQSSSAQTTPVTSVTVKSLCLYCDRTFSSQKLLVKHTERYHQLVTEGRRSSARNVVSTVNTSNSISSSHPGCSFCSTNNTTTRNSLLSVDDLSALFLHMIDAHADKYFGCRLCQMRFSSDELMQKHSGDVHKNGFIKNGSNSNDKKFPNARRKKSLADKDKIDNRDIVVPITEALKVDVDFDALLPEDTLFSKPESTTLRPRRLRHSASPQSNAVTKQKAPVPKQHELLRSEESILSRLGLGQNRSPRTRKGAKNRRGAPTEDIIPVAVAKSSRSKSLRQTGFTTSSQTPDSADYLPNRLLTNKHEQINSTFDDDFYEIVNVNVRQNLSCHMDGKIASGPMSPSPLSPVGPISTIRSTVVHTPMVLDTEIHEATTLSTLTAFPTLLTADQYGCEPCAPTKKKKPITKNSWKWKWDCVKKYKYVNEGGKIVKKIKQPTAGLRDLSKLDMWTQLTMRSKHEMERRKEVESDVGEAAREEKRKLSDELNLILDSRLLPQISEEQNDQRIVKLEPIEEPLFTVNANNSTPKTEPLTIIDVDLPALLNLTRRTTTTAVTKEFVLSGEWARPRCYICFQCGAKFETLKVLEEHNTFRHPHIHTTHYEIVGRELLEKNLYHHFYIPSKAMQHSGMRKFISGSAIGSRSPAEDSMDSVTTSYTSSSLVTKSEMLDNDSSSRSSKISSTRSLRTSTRDSSFAAPGEMFKTKSVCTKCKRQCGGRMDLYRHMLDCSGDYQWQLAKKRLNLKYRYFGNRSRRRRAANRIKSIRRTTHRPKLERGCGTENQRKDPQAPKVRPSDAESIQRMLANLPKKRASRPIIPNLSQKMRGRKPPSNKQSMIHPNTLGRKSTSIPAGRITRGLSLVNTTTTAIGKNIAKKRHVLLPTNKNLSANDGLKTKRKESGMEVRKTRSSMVPLKTPQLIGNPPKKGFIKAIQQKASNIVNKISKTMRNVKNAKNAFVHEGSVSNVVDEKKDTKSKSLVKRALSFKNKKQRVVEETQVSETMNVVKQTVEESEKIESPQVEIDDKINLVIDSTVVKKKTNMVREKKAQAPLKKIPCKTKTREILKIPKVTLQSIMVNNDKKLKILSSPSSTTFTNIADLKHVLVPIISLPNIMEDIKFKEKPMETISTDCLNLSSVDSVCKMVEPLLTVNTTKVETDISPNISKKANSETQKIQPVISNSFVSTSIVVPEKPCSEINIEITPMPQQLDMEEPLNLTMASKQSTSQPPPPPSLLSPSSSASSSALSPPGKRKVRKLNDCIAMLTGKLQQKLGVPFHESETNTPGNVENIEECKNNPRAAASDNVTAGENENTLPNNSSSSKEIQNPAVAEAETVGEMCNKINKEGNSCSLPLINSLSKENELEHSNISETETTIEIKHKRDNIDSANAQEISEKENATDVKELCKPVTVTNLQNNCVEDVSEDISEKNAKQPQALERSQILELPQVSEPIQEEVKISCKDKIQKKSVTLDEPTKIEASTKCLKPSIESANIYDDETDIKENKETKIKQKLIFPNEIEGGLLDAKSKINDKINDSPKSNQELTIDRVAALDPNKLGNSETVFKTTQKCNKKVISVDKSSVAGVQPSLAKPTKRKLKQVVPKENSKDKADSKSISVAKGSEMEVKKTNKTTKSVAKRKNKSEPKIQLAFPESDEELVLLPWNPYPKSNVVGLLQLSSDDEPLNSIYKNEIIKKGAEKKEKQDKELLKTDESAALICEKNLLNSKDEAPEDLICQATPKKVAKKGTTKISKTKNCSKISVTKDVAPSGEENVLKDSKSVLINPVAVSEDVSIKSKPRKKRKNELVAILADQLLESFKEVDKSQIDNLKAMHDLAYKSSEELIATTIQLTPTPKRKTAAKIAIDVASTKQRKSDGAKAGKPNKTEVDKKQNKGFTNSKTSVDDSNIGKVSTELSKESANNVLGNSSRRARGINNRRKTISVETSLIKEASETSLFEDTPNNSKNSLNESIAPTQKPPNICTPPVEPSEKLKLPPAPIKRNRAKSQVSFSSSLKDDQSLQENDEVQEKEKTSNRRSKRPLPSPEVAPDTINERASRKIPKDDNTSETSPQNNKKSSKGRFSNKSVTKVKFNLEVQLNEIAAEESSKKIQPNTSDDNTVLLKKKARSKNTNSLVSTENIGVPINGIVATATSVVDEIIQDFDPIADAPIDELESNNKLNDSLVVRSKTFRFPDLSKFEPDCDIDKNLKINEKLQTAPVEIISKPVVLAKKNITTDPNITISAKRDDSKKSKQNKSSSGDEKKSSQRRSTRRKNTSIMEQENGDNLLSSLSLGSNSSSSLQPFDVKSPGTERTNTIFDSLLLPQISSPKEKGIFGFPLSALPTLSVITTPESVTTQKKPLLRPSILSPNFNRSCNNEIAIMPLLSPKGFKLFASETMQSMTGTIKDNCSTPIKDRKLSKHQKDNKKGDPSILGQKLESNIEIDCSMSAKKSVFLSENQVGLKKESNNTKVGKQYDVFDLLKASSIRDEPPKQMVSIIDKTASPAKMTSFDNTHDSILSEIVKKIQDNHDQTESDDDLCIAEIAKSLNDKIMASDEFSNGVDTPPAELVTDTLSIDAFTPMNVESESCDRLKMTAKENHKELATNTSLETTEVFDQDETTNTEVIDMDLEDDMSVYTSFSADTSTTATRIGGGKKKRRGVKAVLSKTMRRNMKRKFVDGEEKEYICELCNKTYRTNDSLIKHRATLTHISKLSEWEFQQQSKQKKSANNHIILEKSVKNHEDEVNDPSEVEAELPESKSEKRELPQAEVSKILPHKMHQDHSSIVLVNAVLQNDQLSESSVIPNEEPQPPVSKSGIVFSPVRPPIEKIVAKNTSFPLPYSLNQSGIEPISSPEMESHYDRYNNISIRSSTLTINENSRTTLSQEERLFYECCSMLKGSDRAAPAQPATMSKYDPSLSRLGCEEIVTKPVTPKSTDQYTFVGPETAGSTAQMIKSPRSKNSPRQGIPKIDVNQFSDISSDSNSAYFRPEVPKSGSATQHRVFLIDSAQSSNNKLTELLSTAERYSSGTMEGSASSIFFSKTSNNLGQSSRTTAFPQNPAYSEAYIGMCDSFPTSQNVPESENYAHAISTRNNEANVKTAMNANVKRGGNDKIDMHYGAASLPTSNVDYNDDKMYTVRPTMDSPAHSISSQSSSSSRPPTKGALKGYEHLKVSIPTSGLDLQHALDRNQPGGCKLTALADIALRTDGPHQAAELTTKSKANESPIIKEEVQSASTSSLGISSKKKSTGNHLGFKERKKIVGPRLRAKSPDLLMDSPARTNLSKEDVYEFDESQDNMNVSFVSQSRQKIIDEEHNSKASPIVPPSNEDSQLSGFSDRDDFNYGSVSNSGSSSDGSSSSSVLTKRSNKSSAHIIQKKSLIMGRIFKKKQQQDAQPNGVEETAKTPIVPAKQDLDKLFDSLRSDKEQLADAEASKRSQVEIGSKVEKQRKAKKKNEADVEVEGKESVSNRSRSRKPKEMANIEAELGMSMNEIKEMIGVGQRKTQRRCASTKSKTFVETWSSDEYEEFHSTSDIIAMIQEAENKATKTNRARHRNNRTRVAEKKTLLNNAPTKSAATKSASDKQVTAAVPSTTTKIGKVDAPIEPKKPPKIEQTESVIVQQKVVEVKKVTETDKDKGNKPLPVAVKSKQVHFELADEKNDEDSGDESPSAYDSNEVKGAKTKSHKSVRSRNKRSSNQNLPQQCRREGNESDSDFESDWNRAKRSKIRKRRRTIGCRDFKDPHDVHEEKSFDNLSSSDHKKPNVAPREDGENKRIPTPVGRPMPRRKRCSSDILYYWTSSSDEEFGRVKPREVFDDDNLEQHGWIVGDSTKKLVTLLAHAKGKKIDDCGVKKTGKKKI